jgi:ribosomal protein L7Ae-like RNA K-turn-binding protein
MSKILSYLGLSLRAGKLSVGDENALKAIRSGEAKLVLVANDASNKTKKKFADKCSFYKVPLLECCSRAEMGRSIGKEERVVVAITDNGMAQLIVKSMGKPAEVEYIE